MGEPQVDVIMTVFNCHSTVEQSIESIIKQDYNNWNLIINDDCSIDGTKEILSYYERKYTNISIIYNNENKGIANGLNNCLGHSKGKYIAIMDADDLSLPNRLKSEVSYLESHPDISVVGSSMIVFDSHGDRGIRSLPVILNRDSFLVGSPFAHPTTMIRRSVINKLGGYSVFTNRALDLDLWFRLYKQGFKGVNLREPLYKYRETVSDYKRRTFSASLDISKTFFYGFKEISIPWYQRWRALKPIISSLLPSSLLDIYRKSKLK